MSALPELFLHCPIAQVSASQRKLTQCFTAFLPCSASHFHHLKVISNNNQEEQPPHLCKQFTEKCQTLVLYVATCRPSMLRTRHCFIQHNLRRIEGREGGREGGRIRSTNPRPKFKVTPVWRSVLTKVSSQPPACFPSLPFPSCTTRNKTPLGASCSTSMAHTNPQPPEETAVLGSLSPTLWQIQGGCTDIKGIGPDLHQSKWARSLTF